MVIIRIDIMKIQTLGLKKGSHINSMKFSFRLGTALNPQKNMMRSVSYRTILTLYTKLRNVDSVEPFLFALLGGELGIAG